jgi:hypothetical protein
MCDLANLLRAGSLPLRLSKMLADVISPLDENSDTIRVKFKHNSRGNKRDHVRNSAIAIRIATAIRDGKKEDQAISDVAEDVGLEEETVKEIWEALRIFFEMDLI